MKSKKEIIKFRSLNLRFLSVVTCSADTNGASVLFGVRACVRSPIL